MDACGQPITGHDSGTVYDFVRFPHNTIHKNVELNLFQIHVLSLRRLCYNYLLVDCGIKYNIYYVIVDILYKSITFLVFGILRFRINMWHCISSKAFR